MPVTGTAVTSAFLKKVICENQRSQTIIHKRPHREKPYVCDWDGCNQCFLKKGDLKTHKRTHTGEKPYACDWDGCKKLFLENIFLKLTNESTPGKVMPVTVVTKSHKRKRIHTGEKPYACDWDGCEKSFTTVQNRDRPQTHSHRGEVLCL